MRNCSRKYRSYWWPRRKCDGEKQVMIVRGVRGRVYSRAYSSPAAQETTPYDGTRDLAFVGSLGRRPHRTGDIGAVGRRVVPFEGGERYEEHIKRVAKMRAMLADLDLVRPAEEQSQTEPEIAEPDTEKEGELLQEPSTHDSMPPLETTEELEAQVEEDVTSATDHSAQAQDRKAENLELPSQSLVHDPRELLEKENGATTDLPSEAQDAQLTQEFNKHTVDSQVHAIPEPKLDTIDPTIHILGLGAVGKYIAHTLRRIPEGPPVTLLMHRPLVMQQWHDEGATINLIKDGKLQVQDGFHVESSASFEGNDFGQRLPRFGKNLGYTAEQPNTPINTLIVTTDANTTVSALLGIRHRLRSFSTICFIQDGFGILDKVNASVFPDPYTRPAYVLGNITHRVASTERDFTIVENRSGEFSCTKLAREYVTREDPDSLRITRKDFSWSSQSKHMIGSLLRVPELNTRTLGHKSFFATQLQRLAAGSVIGPLAVAYDCRNEELLYNYSACRTMRFLIDEISEIIQALPEVSRLPKIDQDFSPRKLERVIIAKIKKTGRNYDSMLRDVRAGKKTDVDFYLGFLIGRAKELGIECPYIHMLIHTVKGKQAMKSKETNSYIPFQCDY
jgi:2-dehydropantoate 2-reductase